MTTRLLAAHVLTGLALTVFATTAVSQQVTYTYTYDANGNVTQVSDALGRTLKYAYDPLNRRVQVTDALNGVTRLRYDGLDHLVEASDPRNLSTTYTLDGLGSQTVLASPDTGLSTYTHDAAGNVKTRTDAKGQTTRYQYDVLNRITQVSHADGSTVTYLYDEGPNAVGRLTLMTDVTGSTRYAYDAHGRVVLETRTIAGQAYTTAYRHDSAGQLAGMTYPSGRRIDYVRDATGRITQLSTTQDGFTQVLVKQVVYQPFGPEESVTYGNGQTQVRSFNLDGRITSFTLHKQTRQLTYDAGGRITAMTDAGNPANASTFGYDALDRVTRHQRPDASLTYAYDAVGNRTRGDDGATLTPLSYDLASNRLTQVGSRPIQSDANGSIVNDGVHQFGYDARGRMVSATTAAGTVRYQLNGLGQRVLKSAPNGSTVFHYDREGRLIAETRGQVVTEYVYLNDMPVAVLR